MEFDRLEVDDCVRCNDGSGNGKLLVCTEMGCPIALHMECMCAKPVFDEMGNFYYPYCAYKLKFVRTQKLRRKAMASKRVLSKFMMPEREMVAAMVMGGVVVKFGIRLWGLKEVNPRKGTMSRREIENVGGGERIDEDQQEGEVVEETPELDAEPENACYVQEKTNKDHGHDALDQGDEEGIRVSKENEDKSDDEEQRQPEANDVPANGIVVSESELDTGSPLVRKKHFKRKAQKAEQPQNLASLRTVPSPSRESSSRQTSFVVDSKKQNEKAKTFSKKEIEDCEFARNLVLPNGKRKKLNWTGEEVEMFKAILRINGLDRAKVNSTLDSEKADNDNVVDKCMTSQLKKGSSSLFKTQALSWSNSKLLQP